MDVEKFIATTKPKGRKTQLEPFAAQIRQLKQAEYTNQQIQYWLSLNGVTVSVERVRQYAKRFTAEAPTEQPQASGQEKTVPARKASSFEDSRKKAEKYITAEAMNPILRRTLEEQRNQLENSNESDSD